LGCGTGLPGVLASKFAKHVYLTDNLAKTKRLKSLLEFTLKQNGCGENVRLLHYSWGQFDEEFFQDLPKIDYLIGSDVFFDSKCKPAARFPRFTFD
jgi:Lysine methyltransferase